jgi:Eco57I restriction-modification methylase
LGEESELLHRIDEKAETVDRAYQRFRQMQTELGMDAAEFVQTKKKLRQGLSGLDEELDRYLATDYGIDSTKLPKKKEYEERFTAWRSSHQPFHWFVEFYGIMKNGGFDVVIGNPPYVEYSKVRSHYQVLELRTKSCGNIYPYMIERALSLLVRRGCFSFIVPLSIMCTARMESVRELLRVRPLWISAYDMRPSSLFEGVAQRLCILVTKQETGEKMWVGGYRRWMVEERLGLIPGTRLTTATAPPRGSMPKFSTDIENTILEKIQGANLGSRVSERGQPIYVHRVCRYFIKAFDFAPLFVGESGEKGRSEDYKEFRFREEDRTAILCLINSSLFYWYWRTHGDGFHCGYGDVYQMPFRDGMGKALSESLFKLQRMLTKSFIDNSAERTISTKKGAISYQEFYPKSSKPIIDEIDQTLAQHYGISDRELDFIINYDIKYRVGQYDSDGDEDSTE